MRTSVRHTCYWVWLGADVLTVQWFRSYLTGRTQVTDIDGTMSEPKGVTCGVPQGSILGPLLFLLYVNDMASAVRCKLLLYADDSALIASGKNVADIESKLSSELEYVSNWLIDNKLSLHLGKTQSILFGTKRRLSTGVKLNVICNGNVIESKSNVTYLGVTLDQFLSGEIIASNIYIYIIQILSVCLSSIGGQTAGPIMTKFGTNMRIDLGMVPTKYWPQEWPGSVGSLGPISESGLSCQRLLRAVVWQMTSQLIRRRNDVVFAAFNQPVSMRPMNVQKINKTNFYPPTPGGPASRGGGWG